ncbi:MAG: oligosaccharide flippase family protein [Marinagarivorans sp.]
MSLKKNAFRLIAGTGVQVFSQLITIVVLSRLLSPSEFGVVSASVIIVQLLQIFAEFGVSPYLVQLRVLDNLLLGSAVWVAQISAILWAAILILIAKPVSTLLNIQEVGHILPVYSLLYLSLGLCSVQDALHQRNLNYLLISRADSISYLVGYAGISMLCAALNFSYWSIVIGHVSQSFIRCLIIRWGIRTPAVAMPKYEDIHHLLNFCFWQSMSRLASYSASQIDSFIVAQRLGSESMGVYGRSNQLATMPILQLGQILDRLIFPYAAKDNRENAGGNNSYIKMYSIVCYLGFPFALILSLCAKYFVPLILGKQWAGAIEPVEVLLLAMPFRLIHKISDPTARAYGTTFDRAWRQWIVAFFLGSAALIAVKFEYGMLGIAYCVVMGSILDAALMTMLCLKVSKIPWRNILVPIGSGSALMLAVYVLVVLIVKFAN